jgi:hypothetical protein
MLVFFRKSLPNIISYRQVGLSNNLASIPSIIRPLTNSGNDMSFSCTDKEVSKLPCMVVVILFLFDIFGLAPGGRHVAVP